MAQVEKIDMLHFPTFNVRTHIHDDAGLATDRDYFY